MAKIKIERSQKRFPVSKSPCPADWEKLYTLPKSHIVVQRLRVKFSFDRALCDKSMKLGRHVLWTKLIIFRYRATLVLPACCRGNEFNVQVTSSQKIPSTVATIGHSTLQLLPTERAPDSDPESTLLCSFVDIITGLIVRWCSVTKIARLCLFLETSPIFAPDSPNLFWE